jgi:hypothetical protein
MSLRVATWSWLLTLVFPAALLADPQQCSLPSIAEVSPRLPTSADQISIVTLFHDHNCVAITSVVQGNTIHLVNDPFCFLPPPGCGDFLHFPPLVVGPLPAGNYVITLEEGAGGNVVDTQTITVSAPATDLALQSSRFSVGVTWSHPDGRPGGAAQAVRVTDNSGYFWFFDSGDLEVTVKMLDAAPINGRFWLFAASMTNVPFTLTIVDHLGTKGECTATPAPSACTRTYQSPSGKNQNFIDLSAFPSP